VTDDAEEAVRSPAQLVVLGPPAAVCGALAERVAARPPHSGEPLLARPGPPAPPSDGERLRAAHVLAALAERLPPDTVLIEEAPSDRPELHDRIAARRPLGFVSAAMGGLGFGLPAAIGLRMALPDRPVVAVLGDGSSLYGIQGLWSAAHYGVGTLFVVLNNGGYAIMDRLAEQHGGEGPWPGFSVDVTSLAGAFGCPARRIETWDDLGASLDEGLSARDEPLLLEAMVEPGRDVDP